MIAEEDEDKRNREWKKKEEIEYEEETVGGIRTEEKTEEDGRKQVKRKERNGETERVEGWKGGRGSRRWEEGCRKS